MITDLTLVEFINRRLHEDYRVLDGRPIYRIVWSDDQLEVRDALWSEFYGSIFIREYRAMKQIKKYWYMNPPRFVLEKLVFMQGQVGLKEMLRELPEAHSGTYEPLYSFVDGKEQPLPVNLLVVDKILWTLHTPLKRSPSDLDEIRRLEEADEVKYFEEEIGKDERSPLFVFENSAFVSSNQLEYREKMNGPSIATV